MRLEIVRTDKGEMYVAHYEIGDVIRHKLTGKDFIVIGNSWWSGRVIARGHDDKEIKFVKGEIEIVE